MFKSPGQVTFKNYDVKVTIGTLTINLLAVSYEPPVPFWHYELHTHSGYELHFIRSGEGTMTVNDREYKINPGTFYITGPDIPHSQIADPVNPMEEFCLNMEIKYSKKQQTKYDSYLIDEVKKIKEILERNSFWLCQDELEIYKLMEKIMEEFTFKKIGYFTYIKTLITQVILDSARLLSENKDADYFIPKKIMDDSRRYEVDFYFNESHLPLTPKELASKIGISVRQVNRIMLQYYGMTFNEKLTKERLRNSKSMLKNTDLPIKEIAVRAGFSSYYYFSKIFRKHFGMTPSEYKIKKKSEI